MARNTATSKVIHGSWSGGGSYPRSFFIRAQCPDITTEKYAFGLYTPGPGGADNNWCVGFRGDVASDPVYGLISASPAAGKTTSTSFSANTWYALGLSMVASGNWFVWFNGASHSSTSAMGLPTNLSRMLIGAYRSTSSGSDVQFLNAPVACAANWAAALTADDFATCERFSPIRVRRNALRFYAPLVRNVGDLWREQIALTDTGTTFADHPRSYGF